MAKDTAILLFSRSAKEEIAHKQFSNISLRQNKNIAAKLIQQTLQIARSSGLPVLYTNEQYGDDFAERLTHAVKNAFQNGYKQVIAIGNDTPQLTVAHLQQAKQELTRKDIVIGPSTDGGIYLLGIKKETFEEFFQEKFSWQTTQLFAEIIHFFARKDWTFSTLDVLADVDNAKDLLDFIRINLLRFAKLLRSLLCPNAIFPILSFYIPIPTYRFPFHQRPPPFSF